MSNSTKLCRTKKQDDTNHDRERNNYVEFKKHHVCFGSKPNFKHPFSTSVKVRLNVFSRFKRCTPVAN